MNAVNLRAMTDEEILRYAYLTGTTSLEKELLRRLENRQNEKDEEVPHAPHK